MMNPEEKKNQTQRSLEVPCPRCGVRSAWEGNPSRPFCSEKCRLIDLGCWADEEYRIIGDKAPEEGDDDSQF